MAEKTSWLKDFISGNSVAGVATDLLDKGADIIDRFVDTKEEKAKRAMDLVKMEYEDRANARSNSGNYKPLIFVYAIVFLLAYIGLTVLMIGIVTKNNDMGEFAQTIISTLWGGLTAKINTIVDFLFGASQETK